MIRSVNCGFSLVEVLVALGILGIVLLPFLTLISYRMSKEQLTDEIRIALEIAKSRMEEIMMSDEVHECKEIIDRQFLVTVSTAARNGYREPAGVPLVEINVSVFRMRDSTRLVAIHSLK